MTEQRTNTEFTDTVKFSDFEDTLAQKYGERFREYRRNYYKSLNYDANGFLPDFPLTVTMELVKRCNLRCVMCYTINHREKRSRLDLSGIKNVLDECEHEGLPALVVGLGSEPLIFKGVEKVLKRATDAQIMDVFLGTNGILMDEAMCELLIEQPIARVEISLDAATPETYLKVRRKDELERIEHNVHTLIRLKKERNSKLPIIRLCFCVMDINKHEQDTFLKKWDGLVDYVDFQEYHDFSHVDELRKTGTVPHVDQLRVEKPHCAYPFNSLHVWSSGDVTPCCTFFAKSNELLLGNIAESSLKEIWTGDKINKIRAQLLSGDLNPTCRVCLAERDAESFNEVKDNNRERKPQTET